MKLSKLITATLISALIAFPATAATKLRISLQLPLSHPLGQNLANFEKEVERESGGELDVRIFPSAQLYKDKDVPAAVGSGAIEMGVASLTRFAGTIPAVDLFYVPFMFPTAEAVAKATAPDSPLRAKLDAAMTQTGARPLWWQAYGGTVILSKGTPIKSPSDMKGKKVRVFGKMVGEFVKAVGGAPALMSGSEQFLAYQRGTVDAGMTGITGVVSRKLYEVMDYVTLTNHADIEFVVLINDRLWNSLSSEHQEILTKAARRVEKELRDSFAQKEAEAIEKVKSTSMKVIEVTDADLQQWKEASSPVVEAYIDNAGPLGAELVKIAQDL